VPAIDGSIADYKQAAALFAIHVDFQFFPTLYRAAPFEATFNVCMDSSSDEV